MESLKGPQLRGTGRTLLKPTPWPPARFTREPRLLAQSLPVTMFLQFVRASRPGAGARRGRVCGGFALENVWRYSRWRMCVAAFA